MKNKLWGIVAALSLAGAMLAVFLALQEAMPYIDAGISVTELEKDFISTETTEESDLTPLGMEIDFDGLRQMNGDIIGWIYIPGTKVNYPILQHASDNNYYLYHSFKKEENILGSIYIYSEFSADFTDTHMILFGHNMSSGQMFGELSNYSDKTFWQEHPELYLYLPDRAMKCSIYSAYSCSIYDQTYEYNFERGTEEFSDFVWHTKEKSLWESRITPGDDARIITLSTCTDDRDASRRFVVNCIVTKTKNMAEEKQ